MDSYLFPVEDLASQRVCFDFLGPNEPPNLHITPLPRPVDLQSALGLSIQVIVSVENGGHRIYFSTVNTHGPSEGIEANQCQSSYPLVNSHHSHNPSPPQVPMHSQVAENNPLPSLGTYPDMVIKTEEDQSFNQHFQQSLSPNPDTEYPSWNQSCNDNVWPSENMLSLSPQVQHQFTPPIAGPSAYPRHTSTSSISHAFDPVPPPRRGSSTSETSEWDAMLPLPSQPPMFVNGGHRHGTSTDASMSDTEEDYVGSSKDVSMHGYISGAAQGMHVLSPDSYNNDIDEPYSHKRSKAAKPNSPRTSNKYDAARPIRCPFEGCESTFRNAYTCRMHATTHEPKEKKQFVCPVEDCRETFTRKHDRLRHEVSQHGKVPEWVCPKCKRFFSTNMKLGKHTCPVPGLQIVSYRDGRYVA